VFLNFTWQDALDIFISAFFIYLLLIFIKQTRTYFVFTTLATLVVISYIARVFDLGLTRQLFQPILTFFLVIFVIVFQREIRRFFRWFAAGQATFGRKIGSLNADISGTIVKAVQEMARLKFGALVIITGEYPLDDAIEGGFALDGKISSPLILSIFDHTTPGHDGAMIIESKRIKKFGVHLPLAEDFKGFATMGTRHRAGIGISERTDCLAIIVSEERGSISVAENGKLTILQSAGELDDIIKRFMKENAHDEERPPLWKFILVNNFISKLLSIIVAVILWLVLVVQAGLVSKDFVAPVEIRQLTPGYQVAQVTPSIVQVSLNGADHDIDVVGSDDIRVRLDLSNLTDGTHTIKLTPEQIQYPSYLTLTKIAPSQVKIIITKTLVQ
jgi:uncharacterized protein (TIGR00159 family)